MQSITHMVHYILRGKSLAYVVSSAINNFVKALEDTSKKVICAKKSVLYLPGT